jgi:hypothetical protein
MCTHHAHDWSRKKGPGNAGPNLHAKVTLLMRYNYSARYIYESSLGPPLSDILDRRP